MGLDMYLYKRSHVPPGSLQFLKPNDKIKSERIVYILEEVGYWRKANAVHRWFVNNIQNGIDDCGEYRVSHGKLKELLNICIDVLSSITLSPGQVSRGYRVGQDEPFREVFVEGQIITDSSLAEKLLPTQHGPFWGPTDYDETYYADIKHAKEILEEAIQDEHAEYYYSSSW